MRIFCLAFTLLVSTHCAAPGKIVEATKVGIIADGVTLNTVAIQKVIDDCSADGGGTIHFPEGRYVTGTIQLKNNVTLRLDKNAVLLGSTNAADYHNLDPFISGVGSETGYALVVSVGANHVGIEGAGTIDGRGKQLKAMQARYTTRPFLLRWLHRTNVLISDVHLANPGAWTLNFFQTRDAIVERVTIRSRDTGLANNDGIDLDSCNGASIRDCDIESGDDALCLKATSRQPCCNITANNCKLSTRCNAIKLGTESLGDFEHIRVSDCQIRDTGMSGIALYSVDGSHLHDVSLNGITMDGVSVPISIRLGARLKTFRAGDQARRVGNLRDITIRNVQVTGARQIGLLINGVTNHPVQNLKFENIHIGLAGGGKSSNAQIQLPEKETAYPEYNMFGKLMPAYGVYARHVQNATFKNVSFTVTSPDARPPEVFVDVQGATPEDFVSSPSGSR